MTSADSFDLSLSGASIGPVRSGTIFLDNFVATVPEPGSLSLALAALGGVCWRRRRLG